MSDTGSNQSDRGHAMNGLVAFVCIYARYGMPQTEHPVSLQRIREQVAIALLKEEEWHVAIGEQGSSTEHHYGRGVRNFGRIFFFHQQSLRREVEIVLAFFAEKALALPYFPLHQGRIVV